MTDPIRTAVAAERGGLDLALTPLPALHPAERRFRLRAAAGADGFRGTLRLALALAAGETPYVLIPGFFYRQGRHDPTKMYPALGDGPDAWSRPAWDIAAERAAYPCVLAHRGGRWVGLSAEPHYRVLGAADARATWDDDEPQIGLGLAWTSGGGELAINLPANEGPIRHVRNPRNGPTAKRLRLPPGGAIEVEVSAWDLAGDLGASAAILRSLHGRLRREHPAAALGDRRELAACAAHGLLRWHWVPAEGDRPGYFVYTAAMDRSVEYNANVNRRTSLGWHFDALGFVGGFPTAFGLAWHAAAHGDAEAAAVAHPYADRLCREGLSPCGLFRTSYHPGQARTINGRFANGPDEPGYGSCWMGDRRLAHARTTADASLYLARLIALAGDPAGVRLPALRRSLEAALAMQRDDGRHPQVYDVEAGRAERWDGDGGLLWVPAMLAAVPLFAGDAGFAARLAAGAERAGEAYAQVLRDCYVCGAPEDIGLAPSSEDAGNAVMAYAALDRRARAIGQGDRWLDLYRRAGDWMLTWRKAWNVRFDPRNIFGAAGLRTSGGDYASSHNSHLHGYGMNHLRDLADLSRRTGDGWYAERAMDHAGFFCQLLCQADGQWNGQRGMLTEQCYFTDWSIWDRWDPGPAHVQKGTLMGFSHTWCINMVLLGLEQLAAE